MLFTKCPTARTKINCNWIIFIYKIYDIEELPFFSVPNIIKYYVVMFAFANLESQPCKNLYFKPNFSEQTTNVEGWESCREEGSIHCGPWRPNNHPQRCPGQVLFYSYFLIFQLNLISLQKWWNINFHTADLLPTWACQWSLSEVISRVRLAFITC